MEITRKQAREVGTQLGMNQGAYSLDEFTRGMNVELEHESVTKGDLTLTGMIVKDHLDEVPDYYTRLEEVERLPHRNVEDTFSKDFKGRLFRAWYVRGG